MPTAGVMPVLRCFRAIARPRPLTGISVAAARRRTRVHPGPTPRRCWSAEPEGRPAATRGRAQKAARKEAFVILSEADTLLAPVTEIDGFVLACLVDASTGMMLASRHGPDEVSLPTAAAGAADIANVLSLLAGQLAMDEGLEDVMVTFSNHFHVIYPLSPDPEARILLLVVLDRSRTNLAMARREIRSFCSNFAS